MLKANIYFVTGTKSVRNTATENILEKIDTIHRIMVSLTRDINSKIIYLTRNIKKVRYNNY